MLRAAEGNPGAGGAAFDATLRVIPFPASAVEVGRLFRACVGEIPVSVICAICARPELLDLRGHSALEPMGGVSGMVVRRLPMRPTPRVCVGSSRSNGIAFLDCCAVFPGGPVREGAA